MGCKVEANQEYDINLDLLNDVQKQIIQNTEKNLLVLAGAGTGKTSTVIGKITYYIQKGIVKPHEIIATTFTNKAAREMSVRLQAKLGSNANAIWIGTFHKLCILVLEKHAHLMNLKTPLQVLPYDDQLQVVRKLLKPYKNYKPSHVLEKIQRAKETEKTNSLDAVESTILRLYKKELETMGMLDFADLMTYTIQLWREYENVLLEYQNRFKLLCVDEYQDINESQYAWIKLLNNQNTQICCVGDPDQAIYSFRGANIKYILSFEETFNNTEIIPLEQNYRSTQNILTVANTLIEHNKRRIPKKLWTTNIQNIDVKVCATYNDKLETVSIAKEIIKIRQNDTKSSIAILVRTRAQFLNIEDSLSKEKIQYVVTGSVQFMDRAEIKDAISYARFLYNPSDKIAFTRMIQSPKRGIGEVILSRIFDDDLLDSNIENKMQKMLSTLSGKAKESINKLVNQLKHWRSLLKVESLQTVLKLVVQESGLYNSMSNEKQANLQNWFDSLSSFNCLQDYIEHLMWQNDSENINDNAVEIMTIHASKGLEFDYVFLPGWVSNIFPSSRSNNILQIEEERRLAYVAITRARENLTISYALQQGLFTSKPSMFLTELGPIKVQQFENKTQFAIGDLVQHQQLGYGNITEIGMQHAKVQFSYSSKIVEVKSLTKA